MKLVDASNGETLWENAATAATRKFGLSADQIKENFAKGLANQLVDKVFNNPLAEESQLATKKTLSTLTGWRFAGFARDEDTPGGLKTGAQGVLKGVIQSR